MSGSRVYPRSILERELARLHFAVGTYVVHKNGRLVGEIITPFLVKRPFEQTVRWINRNGQEQWVDVGKLKKASPLHLLAAEAPKEKVRS